MDYRQALVEALSKPNMNKQKFVENKQVKTEDTEEFLEPRFDSRASFYKKAKVVKKDNGDEELYSYDTHVGGVRNGKPYSKGKFSQTTTRHQKDYFQQRGFDPKEVEVEENKKIQESDEKDYWTNKNPIEISKNDDFYTKFCKYWVNQTIDAHIKFNNDGSVKLTVGDEDETYESCKEMFESLEIAESIDMDIVDNKIDIVALTKKSITDDDIRKIYEILGEDYTLEENKKITEGEAQLFKKKINKTDIKKVESKKLQETEDMLGRAYDYLDDLGISAADLLVKVSNFFGQDETNEFAHTLLSEMDESKKVEGKEPKRKVISQHNIRKVESKK